MKNKSNNKTQKDYIRKSNFYMLFWIFMMGSVLGFVLEGFWCIVKKGYWEHHAAVVWGPFCVIYGIGAGAVYVLSKHLQNRNLAVQAVVYMLSGAAIEYFSSLFQEICFGSTSWNYDSYFMNLGGRISLKMTFIWGVLGIVSARYIFPSLEKAIMKLNNNTGFTITWILIVFMTVNVAITCTAVARWHRRIEGDPHTNPFEAIFDNLYGDEKMQKLFPNMSFIED